MDKIDKDFINSKYIYFISDSCGELNPGVSSSILEILKIIKKNGYKIGLISGSISQTFLKQLSSIEQDIDISLTIKQNKNFWDYNNFLKDSLHLLCKKKEKIIFHIHGIWQYPQYIGAKFAVKYKKSFIISPHGMLEPWLMSSKNVGILKATKKKMYWRLVALPIFKKASYIHAITPLEKENLSKYFSSDKLVVIPNAIELGNVRQYTKEQRKDLKKRILFVGRLHPIKGVELLVKAFIKGGFFEKSWELWIAGPEEVPEYVNKLKQISKGYEKFIKFIGPVFDERKKFELYATSWITVVPSYSEVVGMVNLESAACYTPTITTYETGLLDWEEGGNILIHPRVEDLLGALKEVINWCLEERLNRGNLAYNFVKGKYSKEAVSKIWRDLYNNLCMKTNIGG